MALLLEPVADEQKVLAFFTGHAQPVQVVLARHVIKAPDGIQRQVDGIELDVCNGMHQNDAPLQRRR